MMESVIHDLLSFYRKTLIGGDNPGKTFLERNHLFDAELIESLQLGYASGKAYSMLGAHRKSSLRKLGLLNHQGERFKNCLVLPVFDLQGAPVDLYGLRIRSTDLRPVTYKSLGILGGQCLREFNEIVFCEYPLHWLHCKKAGCRNAVAARSKTEAAALVKALRGAGVSKVHYLGRKYRNAVLPLLETERIAVNCLPLSVHGLGFDLNALRQLSAPKPKEETALVRETETALYFRAGDIDYRVEKAAVAIPARKAQIKAERENRHCLDRIDFTTAKGRSRFARIAAARLQVSAGAIEEQLADISDCLDRMHLARNADCIEEIAVSPADEADARKILESRDLLSWFAEVMETSLGYAGEESARKLAVLVTASRLLDAPAGAVIRGPSGSGKSKLLHCAAKLLPDRQVLNFSRLTPQALYFLPREKLLHRLLVVDEYEGIRQSEYALRTLMSGQLLSVASTVKDGGGIPVTKTVSLPARLAVLVSTTQPMNQENLSRFVEIKLENAAGQNRLVMQAMAKGIANIEKVTLAQNVNRLLKPCNVLVPFAAAIPCGICVENPGIIADCVSSLPLPGGFDRRRFGQILALVKAHAALNQFQRERSEENGQITVIAQIEDYAAVYALLPAMAEHTEEDLSPNGMALLQHIQRQSLTSFTREQIMQALRWNYSRTYRTLQELSRLELLSADQDRNGVKRTYTVNDIWRLPDWSENLAAPEQVTEAIQHLFATCSQPDFA